MDEADVFPSISAMRQIHSDLLKRNAESVGDDELLADVEAFVAKVRKTGAFMDGREERQRAQSLLGYWTVVLARAGKQEADFVLDDFNPALLPIVLECPYVGLDAFDELHTKFFFGRSRRTAEMVDQLRTSRLLAVIGASGSGKSSVVLGGLIPVLKQGAITESEKWNYCASLVPGSNPLANLSRVMTQDSHKAASLEQQIQDLKANSRELRQWADGAGAPAAVVVDQFEELFTLCQDEAIRSAFVTNLVGLLDPGGLDHRVIITVRSDFVTYLARFGDFYSLFEQAKYDLPPLTRSELRQAIEEPGAVVGLKLEEGLVDALVEELVGEPAGLPLLQFTLLRLWELRERNRLTMKAYDDLGGGRLALERSAESVYQDLLPEDQKRAKYIFLRMARPGKGAEVTGNRIQRKSLYRTPGEQPLIDAVVDKLVNARLVRLVKGHVREDDQLEIAHEALVRNWGRLSEDWLENERVRLRQRWSLTVAAERWESGKRDPGALLRGRTLDEFSIYDDLTALEMEFINASKTAQDEEDKRLQHLASEAQRQYLLATARQLAAQSQLTRYSHRSLLLAIAAVATTTRAGEMAQPAAEEALREALASARGKGLGICHSGSIGAVKITSDGRLLITAGSDCTIRLLDLTRKLPQSGVRVLRKHSVAVECADVTPDGRWLITAGRDRLLMVWDLAAADVESSSRVLSILNAQVRVVQISPDGSWLVVATEAPEMCRWAVRDLESSSPDLDRLEGHQWGVRTIDFSADGHFMISGSDDRTARVWDFRYANTSSVSLAGFGDAIWSVKVTPDGKWLAVGSIDGTVRVWDNENLSRLPITYRGQGNVTAIAVTADSRKLIAGSSDSKVRVWNLGETDCEPIVLSDHEDWISVVTTTRDNRWLITGSGDKTVRIRNLADLSQAPVIVRGHGGCVRSADISRDNRVLATSADDGSVQMVELTDPDRPVAPRLFKNSRGPAVITTDDRVVATATASSHILLHKLGQPDEATVVRDLEGGRILALAASPDEQWIAVGAEAKTPFLINRENEEVIKLEGHSWGIRALAFAPDSRSLVTGSDDHTVRLWNLPEGKAIWHHKVNREVRAVTISPDQRWLAVGDGTGAVWIWSLADLLLEPQQLPRQFDYVWNLGISPDSRWLVTNGYREKYVSVWALDRQTTFVKYLPHPELVTDIAFTPDSKRVAVVTEDPLVRLWPLSNVEAPPSLLRGHEWGIRCVTISSNGKLLVTGSDDKTARLWHLDRPEDSLLTLRGHEAPITDVRISDDGHWLVTASLFGPTRIWDLRLEKSIDLARDVTGRNFTFEEWQQYFPRKPYAKMFEEFQAPVEAVIELLRRASEYLSGHDRDNAAEAYRTALQWALEADDPDTFRTVAQQATIDGFEYLVAPASKSKERLLNEK